LAPAKLCVPHDDSAPAKPIRSAYAYKRPATQVGRWMERDATASAKVKDWAIHASDRRAEKDERQDDAAQPPPEPTLSELLCYMITENRLPALYQQTRRLDVGSQAKEPNLEHLRPPGDAHTDTDVKRRGAIFTQHKTAASVAMQSFRLDHHKSPDKVKHARSAKSRKSEAHTAKHMDLRNAEHFESALSDDSMDSLEEEEDIEPAPPPKFEPKAAPVIDLKEEAKRRRQEKKEGKGIEVLMPKDDLDHSMVKSIPNTLASLNVGVVHNVF